MNENDDNPIREAALEEAEARVLGDSTPVLGYSVEEAFADGAWWGYALALRESHTTDRPGQ